LLTWRPTADGENYPFWYEHPAVIIEHFLFPSSGWAIPAPLVHQSHRQIFHQEGCFCPTDSVFIPVPGPSDYQGRPDEAKWVEDSRFHANRIEECIDEEFNRIFAKAKASANYCEFAHSYWRVYNYCNLPCNRERTKGRTKIGRLLHPKLYDALNLDSLRWLEPGNYDRACKVAERLIYPIVDHCIFRTTQLGLSGVAPPTPGAWGFHFDSSTDLGFQYILRLIHAPPPAPPPDKPQRLTRFDITFRRFKASKF
jgi:hypothetical protein